MKANELMFYGDLLENDRRYFRIPIYQREYKWTPRECLRLLEDTKNTGLQPESVKHFSGSIVYKIGTSNSKCSELFLIDGQQRILTVLLIIKSLSLIAKKRMETIPGENEEGADERFVFENTNDVLYANTKDHKAGLKMVTGEKDRAIFEAIMYGSSYEEIAKTKAFKDGFDSSMAISFNAIYSTIDNWVNVQGISNRNVLFDGLLRLSAVEIKLEDHDDPQEIFDSINSLGIKLSNSDKIRNYLLMTNGDQEDLYRHYWKPIQDEFIGEENMESFVSDFLSATSRNAKPINASDVYNEYLLFSKERYSNGGAVNKEAALIELYEAAEIYQAFIRATPGYSKKTNALLQEFRDMKQTTSYPFLMQVFKDQKAGIIDEQELNKVLNLMVSYLVKRIICGTGSNSLRGFMITLYQRIFGKVPENKDHYYDAVYAFLEQVESFNRMPSDETVKTKLSAYPLYKNRRFATYLLFKIENGRYNKTSGEAVSTEDVTIEHIMPETLSESWMSSLGEDYQTIHDTYVHTIGNLSLSSREKNSRLSNNDFESKKDLLTDESNSKFSLLNSDVIHELQWGRDQIVARFERLSDRIMDLYSSEKADISNVRFEKLDDVVLAEQPNFVFTGRKPVSYSFMDKTFMTDSFVNILIGVASILYGKRPDAFKRMATEHFTPWQSEMDYIYFGKEQLHKYHKIGDGVYIYGNMSAGSCISFACQIIKQCGEENTLVVSLKGLTDDSSDDVESAI